MKKREKAYRIGIDARFLGPEGKGLGRYIQQLILYLEKIDKKTSYIVFMTSKNWLYYRPKSQNFKKVMVNFKWYGLAEQVLFPFLVLRHKIDLMHFPHFNAAILCSCRIVITVHDIILHRYPTRRASALGPIKWRIKNFFYRLIFFIARRRAKKIITVSNFTKQDMQKEFSVPVDKITVIYSGVSLGGEGMGGSQKTLFPGEYFLYVGNAYPHKNLEFLIRSFNEWAQSHSEHNLILIGGEDYFYRRLKDVVSRHNLRNIVFAGQVSDAQLVTYYQSALAVLLPSLYEGFGFIGLEAMKFDTPVIAARTTALPEILGAAALYFDPDDKRKLLELMKEISENYALRNRLIGLGRSWVKNYSWDKAARATLKVYKKILYNN